MYNKKVAALTLSWETISLTLGDYELGDDMISKINIGWLWTWGWHDI